MAQSADLEAIMRCHKQKICCHWLVLVLLGGVLGAVQAAAAQAAIFSSEDLELTGDFRLRLEADWNSQRADGTKREDRARARIRARLGLVYKMSDTFSFGLRLRSGSDFSQQSPHITILDFDGNDTGDADVNLDKWFLKARTGRSWLWVGRNVSPFWRQNELLLDDDATLAGIALGTMKPAGTSGKLAFNTGVFSLPVGMREFSGNLAAAQIVYSRAADDRSYTLAGGLYRFDADPLDPDGSLLLQGNGARDYQVWLLSAQVGVAAGRRPLLLGADYMHNAESYSAADPDPFTAANRDQTDGWVLAARYGSAKSPGDWQLAYVFGHIEAFAINNSYASDDWVRWGSRGQGRVSDLDGHEVLFSYVPMDRVNVTARLFLVEAITTGEDGNRFRLDFNFKF